MGARSFSRITDLGTGAITCARSASVLTQPRMHERAPLPMTLFHMSMIAPQSGPRFPGSLSPNTHRQGSPALGRTSSGTFVLCQRGFRMFKLVSAQNGRKCSETA